MGKFLDANGIRILWSQLSLKDYPNNETLIAVLNAIDNTKLDKVDFENAIKNYATKEDIEAAIGSAIGGAY